MKLYREPGNESEWKMIEKILYIRHQRKCKKMFSDALDGNNDIYIHFDEITDWDNKVRFSIVTEEMLRYDTGIYSDENLDNETRVYKPSGYRPYFFSFIMDSKYINSLKERQNEGNKQFEDGMWYVARFLPDTEERCDSNRAYPGQVQYAASPIKYEDRKIEVIDSALPEDVKKLINIGYTITPNTDDEVRNAFDNTFSGIVFDNAYVYRAGHANIIRLKGHNNQESVSVVYDIGCHANSPALLDTTYESAGRAVSAMQPKAVILSHWDSDHFMGIVRASDSFFEAKWFAPEIANKSANARRLASYLMEKNRIMICRRDTTDRHVACVSNFGLSMGINRYIDSTPENCGGIVLTYEKNDVKSIFCGDVPYRAIPLLWSHGETYDYLIVPHHASKRVKVDGIVANNVNSGYGIVCNNGRKDEEHIKKLEAANYNVLITDDADLCYKINLGTKEEPEKI